MKKRSIALSVMLLLLLVSCGGGGGSGSSSSPPDTNYGIVSDVQLLATNYIAQTGSYIYFKAKLLDGTGLPVANTSVTFTKMSSLGVLSSASAISDSLGYAAVTLYSASAGFATVQAEVSTGAGKVRDKKTVYFSSSDLSYSYSLYLGADGDNDGVYNESADLNLSGSTSTQVLIRAVVLYGIDSNISPVFGSTVTFGTDYPYFSSAGAAACSDGTTVCYVTFPYGNTATTDASGYATVLMQVNSSILKSLTTPLNVTAYADNGSANLLTLYLNPITIASVSLTVSPTSVETDSTANAIAAVKTSTGAAAPDGTAVNFTAACPPLISIAQMNPPFAQTVSGMATSVFNAPSSVGSCSITATSGGVSAIVYISVVSPPTDPEPTTPEDLVIVPGTVTIVSSGSAQSVAFTISGGTYPYTTTSTDPSKAYDSAVGDGVWSGSSSSITVNIPANVAAGTVTLNVYDSKGETTSATLTIISGSSGTGTGPSVSWTLPANLATAVPTDSDIKAKFNKDIDSATITSATFKISETVSGLGFTTGCSSSVSYDSATFLATYKVSSCIGGTRFKGNTQYTATITTDVRDLAGNQMAAPYSWSFTTGQSVGGALTVTPSSLTLTGVSSGTSDNVTFNITGGTSPYTVFSSNTAVIPNPTVSGGSFTIDPYAVAGSTSVTLTVMDSQNSTKTVSVTVMAPSSSFGVNPSGISMKAGASVPFYLLGGTGGPLTIVVSNPAYATITNASCTANASGTWSCPAGTSSFTVNAVAVGGATIQITDINGNQTISASVSVN